jgi:hypothetical protein
MSGSPAAVGDPAILLNVHTLRNLLLQAILSSCKIVKRLRYE